jgi:hypothetical protein
MAYFLFLDESGHDLVESPNEVLAGIAVQDRDVWNLIDAIKRSEIQCFGLHYTRQHEEIKGKKFLKRKVFRHAGQLPSIAAEKRCLLAKQALERGESVTRDQLTALAQAKLAFVREVFEQCARFHCQAFASIVPRGAPRPLKEILRKDYAFLFQRFYYFLEDRGPDVQGAVVFDELEKTQSKILLGQMEEYFLNTENGRQRARQIIPQPFFVHSDLTTMIQVADLIAYVTAWTWRSQLSSSGLREDLEDFVEQIKAMRYRTTRENDQGNRRTIWSFKLVDDLRGWQDRQRETGK